MIFCPNKSNSIDACRFEMKCACFWINLFVKKSQWPALVIEWENKHNKGNEQMRNDEDNEQMRPCR